MFRRVLIANRGEIAVRILRACRELGCQAAAVYSEADADAQHVRLADAGACIGPPEAGQSYLRGDNVIAAARELGCDALHPGYGFLAENADFAQGVLDAGITWIGPPPAAMRRMGLKVKARQVARHAGASVVPGYEAGKADTPVGQNEGADRSVGPTDQFTAAADQLGYPLLVKASAGGGGKGMRLVHKADELHDALKSAQREAQSAFGDPTVYLEKYIERPRHIEIQLLADTHGNAVHLGERECSIQRRHQKVVEETPSVAVSTELRAAMGAQAVAIAREVGYAGAGTIEFILAPDDKFYFLEMNTRLQVEHPVTELVYGLDIVQWQLRIAAGGRLVGTQLAASVPEEPQADAASSVPTPRGHAIELRITAEDPAQGFLPQVGRIELLRVPSLPGVRFDHALREGLEVSPYYDSLLGKLIVWAKTRDAAIARLRAALAELRILGVPTNIAFLHDVLAHSAFVAGELHTGFIAEHLAEWQPMELDGVAQAVGTQLAASAKSRRATTDAASSVPTVWITHTNWSNT